MTRTSHKLRVIAGAVITLLLVLVGYYLITRPGAVKAQVSHDIKQVVFDKDTYPAVVLGGGVGGMTAATYLSLANIKTFLAEGDTPGGLLTQSLSVRNWPGEMDAPGAAITEKVRAQAVRRGVIIESEKAIKVDTSEWPFTITLARATDASKTRTIKALSLIVGIGALSNYLGIPGEKKYWGAGVTNCAVCEGSLYRDKNVCVIGGGDSAIEEASYLSSIARHVTVFVRKDSLRAVDNRKDEVMNRKNVTFVFNTSLTEIKGNEKTVTEVATVNNKTGETAVVPMDGVFLAIGFTPNTSLFKNQLELTSGGYIKLHNDQETSVSGVFAVGDIVDPVYKQAITAAGDGCRAGLQAQRFLADIGYQGTESKAEEKKEAPVVQEKEMPVEKVEKPSTLPVAGQVHEIKTIEEYDALVAQSERPVVVDFYATWCGPCKLMAPLFKRVADKVKDVLFLKVNIDHVQGVAQRVGIYGVPTFTFLKEGKEIDRIVGGGTSEDIFTRKAESLLA